MTSDLVKRVWQHKNSMVDGFTKTYHVTLLVYFEVHRHAEEAIKREKHIKKWKRTWKLKLIEEKNPNWDDLYRTIC